MLGILVAGLAAATLTPAATGAPDWSAADSLTQARSEAQAVLLQDGRVLVAGGNSASSTPLKAAEAYDPSSNSWSSAGDMLNARASFAAAVLPNGKVLAAGGFSGTIRKTADLYNPGTNSWAPTTDMGSLREFHTATLLGNGKVLVTGGNGTSNGLTSTELYNPATAVWSAAGTLTQGRFRHTATLLANGKVLVVGGLDSSIHQIASAEISSADASSWSSAGSLTTARAFHTATLLQNGKVLVAGGDDSADNAIAKAELYNPGTNSWSSAGSMATARDSHTATLLRDGRVLVAGGFDKNGNPLASTEIYNPATNSWSAGPTLGGPRAQHTATALVDGRVLVAGGFGSATLGSAELSPTFAAAGAARRPVIAYVDAAGHFGLYDSESKTDLPVPSLPANLTRFATSLGGRYIVYSDPTTHHIHLFDRIARAAVSLPGIDIYANPDGLTASDSGLIAFDQNSNGPARVYDSKAKAFVDTGLAADNGHRQTRLSRDGRFLAATCMTNCVTDSGGDSDAYVQDLTTKQNVPFPDDLSAAGKDEEHTCINGDGSLVGVNIGHPVQRDVFLYNRVGAALLPVPNDPVGEDIKCVLDSTGEHIGTADNADNFRLYDRLTGALVPLPSKIKSPVSFSDPIDMTPPQTTITSGPSGTTTATSATFTFASSEAGSTFKCSLDGAAFTSCGSPKSYSGLALGAHTFAVRATDASNNTDPTPATRAWTIVAKSPILAVGKVTRLSVSPRAFLPDRHGASITRRKRGTTVRYTLTVAAKVTFTVRRRTLGRRRGKRCVRRTHRNRHKHRCVRYVKVRGKFKHAGRAGKNKFHFTGRLRKKALRPGRYRLVAKPVLRGARSKQTSFRIERRR